MQNPYEILGVDEGASTVDVKKAYFNLIKQFTPEKHGEEFKEIRGAYDRLKDSTKRLETDMFIFSDPYKEFVIEEPTAKREYSAKIDINHLIKTVVEAFSDLGVTDFNDDFSKTVIG